MAFLPGEQALTSFWAAFLGIDEEMLDTGKVVVVPRFVQEDYEGLHLFRRGEGCVVAIMSRNPRDIIERVVLGLDDQPADIVFHPAFLEQAFAGGVASISGPSVVGSVSEESFRFAAGADVREVSSSDRLMAPVLRRFFADADLAEWERSGVDLDAEVLYAAFEDHAPAALATGEKWSTWVANMNLFVRPQSRPGPAGAAALSALTRRILNDQLVPHFRALKSDKAAMGLFAGLGFETFGETIALTFREDFDPIPDLPPRRRNRPE